MISLMVSVLWKFVQKRNFHGGSHVPLIVASLECLELLLGYTKRSTIAHDRGKVYFLTNSKIIDIYIEEFRINLNISTTQLQQKLQMRNINVPETICERTRLKCL